VQWLTRTDDQVDDMMDIAEADIDALLVWLSIELSIVIGNENCSDREGVNNSISKHAGVVPRSSTLLFDGSLSDDEDELESCWNELSARWHVSKQYGRWL
jgi:hypothetical protein